MKPESTAKGPILINPDYLILSKLFNVFSPHNVKFSQNIKERCQEYNMGLNYLFEMKTILPMSF